MAGHLWPLGAINQHSSSQCRWSLHFTLWHRPNWRFTYSWSSIHGFLPPNKDLVDHNKYPATVIELLSLHAELCEFRKVKHIYHDLWLDHFDRDYLFYLAYEEQTNSEKEKVEAKKKSPPCISCQERMTNLNVIVEGQPTALLAFWLSHFVLPYSKEVIMSKTICNDCINGFWAANFFSSNGAWLYLSWLRRGNKSSRPSWQS